MFTSQLGLADLVAIGVKAAKIDNRLDASLLQLLHAGSGRWAERYSRSFTLNKLGTPSRATG